MEVTYVDNHLIIVKKPAGMATQTPGLEDWVKEWVKREFKKPGNVFLQPVHRLDKVASGLVLFARTSKALTRLQAAMRDRKIRKTYRAEVEGIPEKNEATLEHFMEHGDHKAYLSQSGKRAILHYRVIQTEKGKALLEIDLETGRYHQIRLQLASIGHPILGDDKYGCRLSFPGVGIALEHIRLEFDHPVTGKRVII
jgi:23S rRNA pseudouridine1911/1915/1917 synthase